MDKKEFELSRRQLLKWGLVSGAGAMIGGGILSNSVFGQLPPINEACNPGKEAFPISPFIISPFVDLVPQPQAFAPGWLPDPTLGAGQTEWTVRRARFLGPDSPGGVVVPGPAEHQQDVYGRRLPGDVLADGQVIELEHAGTHQVWPTPAGQNFARLINWPAAGVEPILYHIRLQVAEHNFTTSRVRPIDKKGRQPRRLPAEIAARLDADGTAALPPSVIYGFNGTFPGPMINVEYGKPVIVRFENDLDENPLGLDRQNFGAPDHAFLTHLHNGHTAPESDGQPNYMMINEGGYIPGDWVDNLYLNYPAGGDPAEIQSSLWFHDHRMHHTGANVYKGMVGIFPMYDPGIPADGGGIVPGTGLDTGNETDPAPNLGLPGVKTVNPDGAFNVKYDIPLALYDCALDDGITRHADMHIPNPDVANDVCGATHPEWWGKTFFKHYPNHGFVGDIFTVNCVAYPVLPVEARRYRFRFLDASVARIYELCLMTSAAGPQARPGTQGQWQIPDGQLVTGKMVQVASMGGLLPEAIARDSFEIWPATRREFVVDFTGMTGQTIYLTNVLEMPTGRKPIPHKTGTNLNNLKYKVPVLKIVVGDPPLVADQSKTLAELLALPVLRPMPALPPQAELDAMTAVGTEFVLKRSGKFGLEESWLINNLPFDPMNQMHTVTRGVPEVWTVTNGGGGWVHSMHMHQEEHTVLARNGVPAPDARHPDDIGKEDVSNLDPGESVTFYRNFRTFTGRYVAHCHNLAHEDHNMMFAWEIVDSPA